ncbi:hypothetical protein [Segatella copri]|uniref:Uncharacterized protein n=1 Tax=Segatella copri TaxID=165179 RepID=A0AAW5TZA3_9BACT|nr:hypothetical protein [Segatella copri]MCW4093575.1 hypothetical protein [Segatella copri]
MPGWSGWKIKRLISHKLVAGKRIPGSQFAVQRFHHLEIVISQILDGKNTAGLPGQSNQIIYDKASAISLLLKESAGSNSILYDAFQLGYPTMREQFQIEPARLAGTCHISPQTFSVLTETVSWYNPLSVGRKSKSLGETIFRPPAFRPHS